MKVDIQGHDLTVPDDVTSVRSDDGPWGLEVQWFGPEGEANLYFTPGAGWDGLLETPAGVMEQSQLDGTFSMAGAYYISGDLANLYVDSAENTVPLSDAPSDPVESVFTSALMSLNSIDHLVTA